MAGGGGATTGAGAIGAGRDGVQDLELLERPVVLLAMREGAAYVNDNFGWFAARHPRFVYVDRVVVDAAAAGQGVGRRLYDDLFARAREHGIDIAACEYNLEPPNPASKAFHDRFGFVEVGRQHVADGTKLVSLQIARIPDAVTA